MFGLFSEKPFEFEELSYRVDAEFLNPLELDGVEEGLRSLLNSLKVTRASRSMSRRLKVARTSSSVTSMPFLR